MLQICDVIFSNDIFRLLDVVRKKYTIEFMSKKLVKIDIVFVQSYQFQNLNFMILP